MTSKPKFSLKRKGYDRFAVDSYVDNVTQELEFANAKLNVYRKQLDFLTEQLEVKQEQNIQLLNDVKTIKNNIEQINQINGDHDEVVSLAQQTADDIILEALLIAKEILDTLAVTSANTEEYKEELLALLENITDSIRNIHVIEPIDYDLDLD